MNANELRIGNWLRHKGLGDNVKVCCITDRKTFEGSSSFFYYDEFEPIPITQEWIVKFGFGNGEPINDGDFKEYRKWDFYSFAVQFPRGIEAHCYAGNYPVAIKYVHQLQNLYFVLMGKELVISFF